MSKIDHTGRNRSICEARERGETYAKVARDHGISRERVKQIINSQKRRDSVRQAREDFLAGNDIMGMPVTLTELSVRSINSLRNMGVRTVQDMMAMDFDSWDVLSFPNFGKISSAECKAFVEKVRRDNGNNQ